MLKVSVPVYSVNITEDEKKQAATTRDNFKHLLKFMEDAFEHLYILDNALEGIGDTKNFISLGKLFSQYKRKTQKLFNVFIKHLEQALIELNNTISDSEMERIRDVIVSEVREIRDGVLDLLDLLDNPEDKTFIQDFRSTVERVGRRADSLREVITDQLFSHIDHDIMGQIRLGHQAPLSIKRGFLWDLSNIPLRK